MRAFMDKSAAADSLRCYSFHLLYPPPKDVSWERVSERVPGRDWLVSGRQCDLSNGR